MRHLIAFPSVLVCALAACSDPPSPTGPAATEPPSLNRSAAHAQVAATAQLLVTGLEELQGSAVGPGGALFVTAPLAGSIWRVDPNTGAVTLFATGLPPRVPILEFIGSGVVDVAFIGGTAYALVTGVGADLGGDDIVGIYRVDGPNSSTVVADIGAWSIANPPSSPFFAPSGYQYAIEPFRGGFLVTDGHHNRVLRVSRDGDIRPVIAFGNIVPTGLEVRGDKIYVGQAGPIPHLPQNGKVVRLNRETTAAEEVASGAPLIVDVEFGSGCQLYALSQGIWDLPVIPENEGLPASPNTGTLVRVERDGTFAPVVDGLDRPTSVDFIGNTAFVVTLTGKVIRIDNVGRSASGGSH